MNTLAELQAKQAALQAQIEAELAASRAQAFKTANELIQMHGFKASDFFHASTQKTRKPRSDAGKPRGPRKAKPLAIAA